MKPPLSTYARARAAMNPRCIEWIGLKSWCGYGMLGNETRVQRETGINYAHRWAWTKFFGPIPKGMLVCHHCDNRACINPTHLFLGTNADNMADMDRKGRRNPVLGAASPNAKLTEEQVREIRSITGMTQREIALRYGVSSTLIWRVRTRSYWKHVS